MNRERERKKRCNNKLYIVVLLLLVRGSVTTIMNVFFLQDNPQTLAVITFNVHGALAGGLTGVDDLTKGFISV